MNCFKFYLFEHLLPYLVIVIKLVEILNQSQNSNQIFLIVEILEKVKKLKSFLN